jgi:hypothetical protein
MANKFLRALAAVKLVELSEEEQKKVAAQPSEAPLDMAEIDRIIAADEAEQAAKAKGKPAARPAAPPPRAVAPAARAPVPVTPPPVAVGRVTSSAGDIAEGRPFEDLYAAAGVQPTQYPAEKLLRMLDGLRAMDPNTRKAAVLAMDAADDSWTIADSVVDAERKVRVLNESIRGAHEQVAAIAENARAEIEKRDAYLAQAAETIQRKIAELQQTLQQESVTIASQKTEIEARVAAARAAAERESARMVAEIERLGEVSRTFALQRTE